MRIRLQDRPLRLSLLFDRVRDSWQSVINVRRETVFTLSWKDFSYGPVLAHLITTGAQDRPVKYFVDFASRTRFTEGKQQKMK